MKFRDIPQLIREGSYNVNVSWGYLEKHLADQLESGLDMDPTSSGAMCGWSFNRFVIASVISPWRQEPDA